MAGKYEKGSQPPAKLCAFCNNATSKYVCPRCNVLYCSVACYQSELHLQCSEALYRNSVMEYLNCQENSPEFKRKMLQILEKSYQEETEEQLDSDDDLELDLVDRLSGVNLNDPDAVWQQLNDSEKMAFEELLNTGDVTSLVPPWEPWWKGGNVKQLVKEIDCSDKPETSNYVEMCPVILEVPSFTALLKSTPSPYVKWNLLNILGAYCYMIRYFNGDPHDYASEAVGVLTMLSGNLRLAHNYESFDMATEAVAQEVLKFSWLDGSVEALGNIPADLNVILCGPEKNNQSFYMQAALSDICHLLIEAKQWNTVGIAKESDFCKRFGERNSSNVQLIPRKQISIYIKKIEFFLSWVKSDFSMV